MKQKKTKLLFSVLAVTLVGVGAAGGFLSLKAGAEVGWTDATVEREYEYGETLEIPTRSVTVNGKTAEAVSVVEYPNGKTTKSDEITLNVGGRYKIRYTAVVGAKSYEKVYADDKRRVKVGKGPMGIEGVYSKFGLLTFKFKAVKDMPAEDAILMFDVYSKKAEEFTIKLISDYHGAKIEYLSVVKLVGGEVWQNVKVEMNKFKTVEGMPLKKYEIINALEFSSNSEFLLNNALWV